MSPAVVSLALAAIVLIAPPRDEPGLSSWSWEAVESLTGKLRGLSGGGGTGAEATPIVVTEQELNSLLNLGLPDGLPAGVSDVAIRFRQGRIEASALVDVERVQGHVSSSSSWNPFALLSGQVPVAAAGQLISDEGFASLQMLEVSVGSVAVPLAVLEQLVAASTRTADRPEGFDIHAPFRLPFSLKRVRLQDGQASLEH